MRWIDTAWPMVGATSLTLGVIYLLIWLRQGAQYVVLDLHMPGLNGFEVQQTLLERCPGLRVVVITGRDTAEARGRALGLRARAYLAKPVDGDALLVQSEGRSSVRAVETAKVDQGD